MPRITLKGSKAKLAEEDWEQEIVDQLRTGKVLPIISNRLHNDRVLGGHKLLAEKFAKELKYPLKDKHNLPRVALFGAVQKEVVRAEILVKRKYLDLAKNRICDLAEEQSIPQALLDEVVKNEVFDNMDFSTMADRLGYPIFGKPGEDSLLILAELDLPIYLTTSYHCFIEKALKYAGKTPRTAVCRWREKLKTLQDPFDGDYQPSKDEPLVYHLHGLDSHPESLVLTEDDYLEYLVAISRDKDLIPVRIRQALNDSSLMLLGYNLQDYDFRSLFWGLMQSRSNPLQSVCALQIDAGVDEKRYLNRYLDKVAFKVYWGSFDDYIREIYHQLNP